MKLRLISFLVILSAVMVIIVDLCLSRQQETADKLPVQSTQTEISANEADYSNLGLTEEEIQQLRQKGIANVATAEAASKIAGFKVAVPGYIPDSFTAGKFIVQLSGAGLPDELKPKFNNTQVQQYYTWDGEKYPMFLITQCPHIFGISGSEPTEICGHPGERTFTAANPQSGVPYDKLTLGWENKGLFYVITSVLGKNLDEATVVKIACSVRTD
jgi:hypothetical protein